MKIEIKVLLNECLLLLQLLILRVLENLIDEMKD